MIDHPWLEPEQRALCSAFDEGRLGHAPMLVGSAGLGKRALGEWLAARILCLRPEGIQPCGACESCRLIPGHGHPDFFRLGLEDDHREILVDQVRGFIESIGLTPSIGTRRVGLVDPAERLNNNAANALLKTLEEPADEVWLVLVTDRPDRLPVTVLSRCQRHHIAVPSIASVADWLSARHPDRSSHDCELALKLADGAPLTADAWLARAGLEQGLAVRDLLATLVEGRADSVEVPEAWLADPDATWTWLARWTEAWMKRALTGRSDELGDVPGDAPATTASLAASQTSEQLQQLWDRALYGRRLSGSPVRHDWLMQSWLLEWTRLAGRLPVAV